MLLLETAILRMRLLPESATKRLPPLSNNMPMGSLSIALVAAPPSPEKPVEPVPAMVSMMLLDRETRRTRLLKVSAMYTYVSVLSTATP